jgi:CheY-like chemotaxis protein
MSPETSPTRQRRRVLIVDDNRDVTASMRMVMDRFGQDVRIAHDGPSALTVANDFRPDLVFLDLGLPGMDGYEVARRLREQPGGGNIEIIAVSGWGDQKARELSAAAGVDQHWLKPLTVDDLEKCFQ